MSWAVEVAAVAGYPAWALGPGERERESDQGHTVSKYLAGGSAQAHATLRNSL